MRHAKKIMHENRKRRAGSPGVLQCSLWGAGLMGGAVVACAGTNTLEVDQETRDRICDTYGCDADGEQSGSAGGSSGADGSGADGSGAGGAGGTTMPMGGTSGTNGSGNNGSGGTTMPMGSTGGGGGTTLPTGGTGGSDVADGSGGMPMGGDGNVGGSGPVDACDGFMVLEMRCAGSNCHGARAPFSTFAASLSDAEAFFDAPSSSSAYDHCGPMIEPGNPEGSFIYLKAAATLATPGCGSPMPLGTPGLEDDELDCLGSWISSL